MPDVKERLFALIKAALPRVDYYALYRGKIIAWHTDTQTVDVQPDAPGVPSMSGIEFRGPAGFVWDIDPHTDVAVLVGWENGDPSRAFAEAFTPGVKVLKLTMNADQIILGGSASAEPAAKGQTLQSYLDQLAGALTAHIHPTGSGPSGVAANLADIAPPDILATNVQVK